MWEDKEGNGGTLEPGRLRQTRIRARLLKPPKFTGLQAARRPAPTGQAPGGGGGGGRSSKR